jgi:hypothetical protein
MKGDVVVTAPADFQIPDEEALLARVQSGIKDCKALFADPAVTELETPVKVVKKKEEQASGVAVL